jgi:hypothetical protein
MKRFAVTVVAVAVLGLCSAALAASFPFGMYKTKIHSTALGGALNGTWTVKFGGLTPGGDQSLYTVTDNGVVVIHGKDTIKATKITFNDLGGKDACMGAGTTGTYKFKLKGTKLRFTKVGDACAGRAVVFKGTFTKVG